MIKIENECVGCPPEMGCMSSSCPYRNVPVLICDKCNSDYEEQLHLYKGQQLCFSCFLNNFEQIGDDTFLVDEKEIDIDELMENYCEETIDERNYDDYM